MRSVVPKCKLFSFIKPYKYDPHKLCKSFKSPNKSRTVDSKKWM